MELTENILQELKSGKIQFEELDDQYFTECKNLGGPILYTLEVENILKLLNENICSFKQIVDKIKSIKDSNSNLRLSTLLYKEELFKELFKNNLLNQNDLRYLLNRIDNANDLCVLCDNIPVIKFVLDEFLLNRELVDKFSRVLGKTDWYARTIFDLIAREIKIGLVKHDGNDKEILKLNELNKYTCTFDLTKAQRVELFELIQNNKIAKNRLIQLIDNNLEDQYDFDSLMRVLTKDEEKKKIKMNF